MQCSSMAQETHTTECSCSLAHMYILLNEKLISNGQIKAKKSFSQGFFSCQFQILNSSRKSCSIDHFVHVDLI